MLLICENVYIFILHILLSLPFLKDELGAVSESFNIMAIGVYAVRKHGIKVKDSCNWF
jgi:hypothetical protein